MNALFRFVLHGTGPPTGGAASLPGTTPAVGPPPRPPVQQEPDADVLQIANVDVDAEQSTLMADLSRPQQPQPGQRHQCSCSRRRDICLVWRAFINAFAKWCGACKARSQTFT